MLLPSLALKFRTLKTKKGAGGSSCCGSVVMNLTSIHEDVGWILDLSVG